MSPRSPQLLGRSLAARSHVLAGSGRWREARVLLDSLKAIDPGQAGGIQAWSVVLGLTPPSAKPVLDSVVQAMPPGPQAAYANAMLHVIKGQAAEGRRLLSRELGSRDSASIPAPVRGLMIAGDGWAALLQGDSVGGIRRMRYGLDLSAAPNEESAFPRLQFALALAARPETGRRGSVGCATASRRYRSSSRSRFWHSATRTRPRASATQRRCRTAGSCGSGTRRIPSCKGG